MSVRIRQVHIENFRSIQRLDVSTSNLTIFVGKNDCGKSNILRAINLFFNGMTNLDEPFNFEEDYNFFVPDRAKVAKEIVVRLELDIPNTYHATNGDIIIWEKRWRAGGLHTDTYKGARLSKNRRGREVRALVPIPERSNAHALLRQVEFVYVPAIKDANYFDGLRGRIYSIIAEVAARTFRTSSAAFEQSIGEHLLDLTAGIGQALNFDTRLALPRDLSHIFERLDFLSGEKAISLDHRGDGIKARHIPIILEFMANKKQSLQVRGGMPHSFIWAYEEPENNLEFASAVQLADQLADFSARKVAQILLTTHSPVFYDLAATKTAGITCAHVFRDTDEDGTQTSTSATEVDEKMGTMALLAPRIKQAVQNVREQAEATLVAERLAAQNRPQVFVEGESDRIVLRRCLDVFHPAHAGALDLETKLEGAGHSYVVDMLMGWRAYHKHHTEGPRAAGILDCDAAAKRTEWNNTPGHVASAKCFCYPKPAHAVAALQAGFNLPVTLEVLYDAAIWAWADEQNLLEDRPRIGVFPPTLVERILRGEDDAKAALDDVFAVYVTRHFATGTKIKTANYVAALPEDRIREQFAGLGTMLGQILTYLGLAEAVAA
jgi:hypothetical protein